MKKQTVMRGETVLLREGNERRLVRVIDAEPVRSDGSQPVSVQNLEPFGRSKPRRVTLGATAHIEPH
jgi:hypothetical protein